MNNSNNKNQSLSRAQHDSLLDTLQARFAQHMQRHAGIEWAKVAARLNANAQKLRSLNEMERTGGEPDVVAIDRKTGEVLFYDCSPESPEGRRSLCFDQEALAARKVNKPVDSAMHMAAVMGVELLGEEEYRHLQQLGEFDLKTSSWVKTPDPIRKLGGALFMDRRYDHVFLYHNGADSYYGARGFRGFLKV